MASALVRARQKVHDFLVNKLGFKSSYRPGTQKATSFGNYAAQQLAGIGKTGQQFVARPLNRQLPQPIRNFPIAGSIAQGIVSSPYNTAQGFGNLLQRPAQRAPIQKYLGDFAQAADLPFNIATFGKGPAVLKSTLGGKVFQNAKLGFGLGAGYGNLQGLQQGRNSSLQGQLLQAGQGGLIGGVAGGALGASTPLAGNALRRLLARPGAPKPPSQLTGFNSQLRTRTKLGSHTNIREVDNPLIGGKEGMEKFKTTISQAKDSLSFFNRKKPDMKIEDLQDLLSNKTNIKNKVNILDFARTPDRVLHKMGLGHEADNLRNAWDSYLDELPKEIQKVTDWSKRVTPEGNERIFKYLDGTFKRLDDPTELKVANEIQEYLQGWAKRLGLPEDKRISSYITHIWEKGSKEGEFDEDIAKIIADRVPGSVYDPFVEQRLGKQGYIQDTWRALDAYIKRATRKANMDPVLERMSKNAESLELSQYKYLKNHIERVNLRPTDLDTYLDNFIKSSPVGYKFGARPTTAISRNARQMVYRATLGLNPGSALKNLTQGANTYAKLGERWTLTGYYKAIKALVTRDDELTRVGVLRDNFVQDRTINATRKFWEKADKGLFVFFDTAEKINRGAAYFGAKSQALSKGMSEEQAIQYAKKIVRDTQFVFGAVDTPAILQGDINKTLFQFQSFTFKQAEFLGEMIAAKDVAGMLRWSAASFAMVATIGKAIGMEPKDLIPSLRLGVPPTLQAPWEAIRGLTDSPDAYGNKRDIGEKLGAVANSALLFVPGSVQAKKTLKAITEGSEGASRSQSGLYRYPSETTPQSLVFGSNKTDVARLQRFLGERGMGTLSKKQEIAMKRGQQKLGVSNEEAYAMYQYTRLMKNTKENFYKIIKDKQLSDDEKRTRLKELKQRSKDIEKELRKFIPDKYQQRLVN